MTPQTTMTNERSEAAAWDDPIRDDPNAAGHDFGRLAVRAARTGFWAHAGELCAATMWWSWLGALIDLI